MTHFDNEIHRCERDEARSARYGQTEMERARGCQHRPGRSGGCVDCGEQVVARDEL